MNHLFALRDHLIANVDWLYVENCDIDNTAVFDYASMNLDNPYAVIISHIYSDIDSQSASFQNVFMEWKTIVNFFSLMSGSKDEQSLQVQDAYRKSREIIDALGVDFTLGNEVLDCRIHAIMTPMTYNRNNRDEYFMLGIVTNIKEGLYD